jgi:hypothetical protein
MAKDFQLVEQETVWHTLILLMNRMRKEFSIRNMKRVYCVREKFLIYSKLWAALLQPCEMPWLCI